MTPPPEPPIPSRPAEPEKPKPAADENKIPEPIEAKREPTEIPKPPPTPVELESWPESLLHPPEKNSASPRMAYDTLLLARASAAPVFGGWQYRKNQQGKIIGFEFSNQGGNRILPYRYDIEKNLLFTRDFQFHFDDRARQDIHLHISDWAPSRDRQFKLSELMDSVIHFFPRNYLPTIVGSGKSYVVTLPTGEQVEFDARTHEILAGVFSEAPVDLNPDKTARKFARVNYTGKGVTVRANARGKDPRLGTMAMITTGSPPSECKKKTGCSQCRVPSRDLWYQNGAERFKFSTDSEFDRYLQSHCGFGIPKIGTDFMLASPQVITKQKLLLNFPFDRLRAKSTIW